MKTYHALACKELRVQKMMSLLILTAILLSAMMTAAVGQSLGILAAMRQQQAVVIGGDRYVTFVQMKQEQVETMKEDPRLSFVGTGINMGTVDLNGVLKLALVEYAKDDLEVYPADTKIREGRLPEKPMELALPEDALQLLGFQGQIGDTITLSPSKTMRHDVTCGSYEYTAEFTLTGITESNYLGYSSGLVQGITGEGSARALLPDTHMAYNVDIRTVSKSGFQSVIDDLIRQFGIHSLDVLYNEVYLNALGIFWEGEGGDGALSDSGFSYMTAAGILTGALILLAAGLVIYNILKISVAKEVSSFGVLRAMGGEKGQLYLLVTERLLLLCLPGIPAGLLAGVLCAEGILRAALGQFSPEVFLAGDREQLERLIADNSGGKGLYLAVSAGITLAFAFAAAIPAARYAARISPVAAIRETGSRIRRRGRRERKIRIFEAYYARLNMKRNRSRTAITILSLVMSITVFITLQGFVELLDGAGRTPQHLGDYEVVNEVMGFSPEQVKEMGENGDIAWVAAMQFREYGRTRESGEYPAGIQVSFALKPGEVFTLVGLNQCYSTDYFGERLSGEELALLEAGEGCVVRNPVPLLIEGEEVPRTRIEQESILTVEGKEVPVLETMDGYDGYFSVGNNGFTNGVQMIVSDGLFRELTGEKEYAELHLALREGAQRERVDDYLEALCRSLPGTTYLSYEQTDRQLEESAAQINFLAWGLILFVGLIGILNIINTVYTNIHTRVGEIGMQRAIGMSRGSLYKTFLWEGAYYGLYAALFGGMAGYLCNLLVEAAIGGEVNFASVPLLPMAEAALVSLAACLLATCIPLRRIAGMGILEAVEEKDFQAFPSIGYSAERDSV